MIELLLFWTVDAHQCWEIGCVGALMHAAMRSVQPFELTQETKGLRVWTGITSPTCAKHLLGHIFSWSVLKSVL